MVIIAFTVEISDTAISSGEDAADAGPNRFVAAREPTANTLRILSSGVE